MENTFEAFRTCISDGKCTNHDCPYYAQCEIAYFSQKEQYVQIPKFLAADVVKLLVQYDDRLQHVTEIAQEYEKELKNSEAKFESEYEKSDYNKLLEILNKSQFISWKAERNNNGTTYIDLQLRDDQVINFDKDGVIV